MVHKEPHILDFTGGIWFFRDVLLFTLIYCIVLLIMIGYVTNFINPSIWNSVAVKILNIVLTITSLYISWMIVNVMNEDLEYLQSMFVGLLFGVMGVGIGIMGFVSSDVEDSKPLDRFWTLAPMAYFTVLSAIISPWYDLELSQRMIKYNAF